MHELVRNLSEIRDNVFRFNAALNEGHELSGQLSQFRHWYYVPEIDAFGPSKFVGYRDAETASYKETKFDKDGRETEHALRQWFRVLEQGTPEWQRHYLKLGRLLATYGKCPNAQASIHVPG
jgi:hypothetical protein